MSGGTHSPGSSPQHKNEFGNGGEDYSRSRCGELKPKVRPARDDGMNRRPSTRLVVEGIISGTKYVTTRAAESKECRGQVS